MLRQLSTNRIAEVYDFEPNEFLLGWNSSTWSWNDDYSSIKASLVVNVVTGKTKLIFTHIKEKYGLGKGSWFTLQSVNEVGTLKKLEKGKIRTLLKENNNYSTPFRQRGWGNADVNIDGLRLNQLLESNIKIQRLLKINKLINK